MKKIEPLGLLNTWGVLETVCPLQKEIHYNLQVYCVLDMLYNLQIYYIHRML
jgi:hypothetical protein